MYARFWRILVECPLLAVGACTWGGSLVVSGLPAAFGSGVDLRLLADPRCMFTARRGCLHLGRIPGRVGIAHCLWLWC